MAALMSPQSDKAVRKLLHGMVYFLFALILMGIVLFWLWPTNPDTIEGQASSKVRPPQQPIEMSAEIAIQGPQAGENVPPPSRNVTPNYHTSPLNQTQPLPRTEGNHVPKIVRPKGSALGAASYRRVIATGPVDLVLPSKRGEIKLRLAHVAPPEAGQLCWSGPQKVDCRVLARTALRRFIRQRAVSCDRLTSGEDVPKHEQAETDQATCYLGAGLATRKKGQGGPQIQDLAAWMVKAGWLIAHDGHYKTQADHARQQQVGIYAPRQAPMPDGEIEVSASVDTLLSELARDLTPTDDGSTDQTEDNLTGLTLIAPPDETSGASNDTAEAQLFSE